jgi:hypothetical protein
VLQENAEWSRAAITCGMKSATLAVVSPARGRTARYYMSETLSRDKRLPKDFVRRTRNSGLAAQDTRSPCIVPDTESVRLHKSAAPNIVHAFGAVAGERSGKAAACCRPGRHSVGNAVLNMGVQAVSIQAQRSLNRTGLSACQPRLRAAPLARAPSRLRWVGIWSHSG